MEKVCIFCGEHPVSKTLEHVLPQWLIELTGNPKRRARFGYKKLGEGKFAERSFAFDAFKFPSCMECNRKFANLEAVVKVIVHKMMSEDCLSESELSTLLDWFDKVRIGLWLGYLYLNRNPLGISPNFHVQNRISQHDRMIAIFKTGGNMKGLNSLGCETPAFAQTPSCFSLRINNLWFLNMSLPNLLARRMGFPFPRESYTMDDGRLFCYFSKGLNRIMRPILKKPISIKGTELYQPLFSGNLAGAPDKKWKTLYNTKYVRNNCISWEKGIGRIYIKKGSEVVTYNTIPSMEWLPEKTHDLDELSFEMQSLTLEWQLYIINNLVMPSVKYLSKDRRRQMVRLVDLGKYYNRAMLEHLTKVREGIDFGVNEEGYS
jgi:hypothetical protein